MGLFSGQADNAKIAAQLRKRIPDSLKKWLDFRPKKSGLTLVSYFDWAPMRGLSFSGLKEGNELLSKIRLHSRKFLGEITVEEKLRILGELGFKRATKKKTSEYLEFNVQAAIIRDLLNQRHWYKKLSRSFCNKEGVHFLTSELEWSLDGVSYRPDIICIDNAFSKIIILELKIIRQKNFQQVVDYKRIILKNMDSFKDLVRNLAGKSLCDKPQILTGFVMPYTSGKQPNWHVVGAEYKTKPFFYTQDFPPLDM
jgi:hypothetical protein